MHFFVILQFYTILCILICCEAPRTILDLALYQIKYIIIIYNHIRPIKCIGIDFLIFFHDPTFIRSNTVRLEIALFHFYCSEHFLLNLKSSYNI